MFSIKFIYEKYKKDVFTYLISLSNNPTLSEDLVSETFLAAIKSLPNFKGDSDIKTWLFSIARYKWYDYLRKKSEVVNFEDLAEIYLQGSDNIERSFINKTIASKIMDFLNVQEARTKDIVIMRIEGYSFHEIATKYNISENSARVINFRAKRRIRKLLEKEGLGDD
ncbi:MAG TPA: sigma-70 family RNA polymerase sigma factor [Thermoanaerobacterales bacterium]|nr:sigma-70 family RNA polymerase sigma factor [Thermoanaerobacterales bacterium]